MDNVKPDMHLEEQMILITYKYGISEEEILKYIEDLQSNQ